MITPPNADCGSHASAFAKASSMRAPMATPHGFVCLMITHAGSVNSRAMSRPAEMSAMLLNVTPRPPCWCTIDSTWRRAPRSE